VTRKAPPDGGEDERSLFEQEMKDVRPLDRRTGRVVLAAPEPSPARPRRGDPPRCEPIEGLAVIECWGERLALLAPGVDRRALRELGTSAQPPEAALDLHGLTAARAVGALGAFITRARGEGRRRVLVVHGRGHRSGPEGPVLRQRLIEALLAPPLATLVLAVVTAPPALGGSGAALLLLRRR
jgi:DNA-nicking Smr family endonuclease